MTPKFLLPFCLILCTSLLAACAQTKPASPFVTRTTQTKPFVKPDIPPPFPVRPETALGIKLDDMLETLVREGDVPGLTLLVMEHGKEVYFGKAGFRDMAAKKPMQRETVGRLYSMTKPITGVALMQLYEQGKFKLDDPLSKYLPEFKNMRVFVGQNPDGTLKTEPAKHPITIRDLMRHTAGFSYGFTHTPVDALYVRENLLSYDQTNAEFTRHLAKLPLLYQPGERFHYSVAVDVQGRLVEVLSGQALGEYFEAHIFGPLGMNHTGFTVKTEDKAKFAPVYGKGKDGLFVMHDGDKRIPLGLDVDRPFLTDVAFESGGGGLVSTIDDYARFANALLAGGSPLLKPETLALMHQDQLGNRPNGDLGKGSHFGLDFAIKVLPQAEGDYHVPKGSYYWGGMANTMFMIDPENDRIYVLFTQVMGADRHKIHNLLTEALYGN